VTATEGIGDSTIPGAHAGRPHFEIYAQGSLGVRWRLLSGNNRDSGRSAVHYVDSDACLSGLRNLIELVDDLQPVHVLAADNRWEWRLCLGSVALASSSRTFDRRLRCVASSQWFVSAAPLAEVRPEVRIAGERVVGISPLTVRVSSPPVPPARPTQRSRSAYPPDGRAGERHLLKGGG
jgi:hypothetical protein